MSREKCNRCSKPLGGTSGKCHNCGGSSRRGGRRIGPEQWQILLGVAGSA